MKYKPSNGAFAGQSGYGYVSFERFVDACAAINRGEASPQSFDASLPTVVSPPR